MYFFFILTGNGIYHSWCPLKNPSPFVPRTFSIYPVHEEHAWINCQHMIPNAIATAGLDISFISYLPCRASRRKLHLIQKLFALVVVDEGCQNSSSQSVWFWHADQSQSVSLIGYWECVHLWLFCSFLVRRLNKVNQLNATHSFIMEKGSRKILFKQTSLTLRWNMLHVSFTSSLESSAVCLCCVFLQRCWSELESFDWLVDSWTVFIILCAIIFCDIS